MEETEYASWNISLKKSLLIKKKGKKKNNTFAVCPAICAFCHFEHFGHQVWSVFLDTPIRPHDLFNIFSSKLLLLHLFLAFI